jgi:outer membrane protein OmpA-like peptidoglycan-associated protein
MRVIGSTARPTGRLASALTACGLALLSACSYTNPSGTLAAPTVVAPANGIVITTAPILQPTLTVTNSVATGTVGTVTYRFEVSLSAGFATTVAVGDPIPQGSGTTSYTVTPQLPTANTTYFWHVRATDGTVTSAFSATSTFVVPQPGCSTMSAPHVHFDVGGVVVRTGGDDVMALMARSLLDHPDFRLSLEGYTDDAGSARLNLALSRERAEAVARLLVAQYHVPADRLTTAGYGAARPLFANKTPEGRAGNRRVEFVELKQEVAER